MKKTIFFLILIFLSSTIQADFYHDLDMKQRMELSYAYYQVGKRYDELGKEKKGKEFIHMAYLIYPELDNYMQNLIASKTEKISLEKMQKDDTNKSQLATDSDSEKKQTQEMRETIQLKPDHEKIEKEENKQMDTEPLIKPVDGQSKIADDKQVQDTTELTMELFKDSDEIENQAENRNTIVRTVKQKEITEEEKSLQLSIKVEVDDEKRTDSQTEKGISERITQNLWQILRLIADNQISTAVDYFSESIYIYNFQTNITKNELKETISGYLESYGTDWTPEDLVKTDNIIMIETINKDEKIAKNYSHMSENFYKISIKLKEQAKIVFPVNNDNYFILYYYTVNDKLFIYAMGEKQD